MIHKCVMMCGMCSLLWEGKTCQQVTFKNNYVCSKYSMKNPLDADNYKCHVLC